MKLEQPWVYDGKSLESYIKEMVETVNGNCDDKLMEISYLIGRLPEGYDVKIVIEKQGGGCGTCLELESNIPYVGDL